MSLDRQIAVGTLRNLRGAGWALAALLVLLPAVAMQFSTEVRWGPGDFLFAAIAFALVGGLIELAARANASLAYLAGSAIVVIGCFALVWINLAVGIIGAEDDPRNLAYFAIVGMAATGAFAVRGSAEGLKRTMMWITGAQLLVALMHFGPAGMAVPLDLLFAALWGIATLLFAKASKPASSA